MRDAIMLKVNGEPVMMPEGITVASALLRLQKAGIHRSISGELRGAVCGMGVCFECRVTVNGRRHVRSCLTMCEAGMEIRTDE